MIIDNCTTHPLEIMDTFTHEVFRVEKSHTAIRVDQRVGDLYNVVKLEDGHSVELRDLHINGIKHDNYRQGCVRIVSLVTAITAAAMGYDTNKFLVPVAPGNHELKRYATEFRRIVLHNRSH